MSEEKTTHKCLVLGSLITNSELIVSSPNHPLGISAKFTEVAKGVEIELDKDEAIRLEKIGSVEILDKPVIPSPKEIEVKQEEDRLEKLVKAKFESLVKPLQDQVTALTDENSKLKEELSSKKK